MFMIFHFMICFIGSFMSRYDVSVHVVVVFTVNRVVFRHYIIGCYCLKKTLEFLVVNVCPFICHSRCWCILLLIAETVQDNKICVALHHKMVFLLSLGKI